MAFIHSPRVVTNGLQLYLDAANIKSYPGSGTTWKNLGIENPSGSLVNGPTFDSGNWGSIAFDGTNDYATFFAPNITTTATVEMWAKIGAGYSNKMFFGWLFHSIYCVNGAIGYNTGNGDSYGISSTTVTNLGLVGNWKHYIFEMRSDVSYTNNKLYINTSLQSLSQQLGSENAVNRTFNSGNGGIALWRGDSNPAYCMPMNCSIFKVYNRILSIEEIQQNFNATRARFGV